MSLEENKVLVRRFFAEVLNPWNVEALADFLVPNSFFSGFMQKFVAEGARGIPDAETTVNELFGENDKVTACTTQRGTNIGPLLGHPPTQNSNPQRDLGVHDQRWQGDQHAIPVRHGATAMALLIDLAFVSNLLSCLKGVPHK